MVGSTLLDIRWFNSLAFLFGSSQEGAAERSRLPFHTFSLPYYSTFALLCAATQRVGRPLPFACHSWLQVQKAHSEAWQQGLRLGDVGVKSGP